MEHSSVRASISNARFNENNSNILFAEITLISLFLGVSMQSWWWGGGVYISFIVALQIQPIAIFIMVALSLAWGWVGYSVGAIVDSVGAMVVLTFIGFFIGLGVHMSALEWTQDVG